MARQPKVQSKASLLYMCLHTLSQGSEVWRARTQNRFLWGFKKKDTSFSILASYLPWYGARHIYGTQLWGIAHASSAHIF